jgi:hypothetical protein
VFDLIKSKRISWAGRTECMEEMINMYKILILSLKGRDHSKDLSIDVKILK